MTKVSSKGKGKKSIFILSNIIHFHIHIIMLHILVFVPLTYLVVVRYSGHSGQFEKIPVTVVNLGDTTHNMYKTEPNLTVSPTAGVYSTVVSKFQ